MRWFTCALVLTVASALMAPTAYGQTAMTATISFDSTTPKVPTPFQMSVVGLGLTAIAVVAARVSNRSSNVMMFMVLACIAVTAILTAYSDRVHSEFVRAGFEKLEELRQQYAVAKPG
jgi:hypothetical protein